MTLNFINVIPQCDDLKYRERDFDGTDTIAVHRIGKELGNDAIEICRRFIHDPAVARYTGGSVAYTFIVGETGTIWQCLPLGEVGAHARRWNRRAIGIACIGDFRVHVMPNTQRNQLVKLCAVLQFGFPRELQIKGHDELPGGSSNENKKCPGSFAYMNEIRRLVAMYPNIDRLKEMGLEL